MTIVEYIGKAKDVVVPSTIDGYPVKVIGDGAFWGCRDIETLKLPDSVEAIESGAFEQTSFEEFVFPPKITVINGNVFFESYIQKVVLPEHVEEIQGGAFSISALTEINIPDSVTSISEYSFEECPRSLILFYNNNLLVPQYAQKYNILCYKISEYNPVMNVELVGGKPLNDDQNLGISQDNYNLIDRQSMNSIEDKIQRGVIKANDYSVISFENGIYNSYSGFSEGDDLSQAAIQQKLTKLTTLLYQCGITEFDPKTINTGKMGCFDHLVTAALYCRWPQYADDDVLDGCDVRFAEDDFLFAEALALFDFTPETSLVTGYSEQQHGIWYYPKEFSNFTIETLSYSGNLDDGNFILTINLINDLGAIDKKTFSYLLVPYNSVSGNNYRVILKSIQ